MAKTERLEIRIDADLKAKIQEYAEKEGRTSTNFIENIVTREIDELTRKYSKKVNYDSIVKAAEEFNSWSGSASVMLDKSDGEVWTDVFADDNEFKRYHSASIMCLYGKNATHNRNEVFKKEELHYLATLAMEGNYKNYDELLGKYMEKYPPL